MPVCQGCDFSWYEYNLCKKKKYDYYKITLPAIKELFKQHNIKCVKKDNKEELVNILIQKSILAESYRKPTKVWLTLEDKIKMNKELTVDEKNNTSMEEIKSELIIEPTEIKSNNLDISVEEWDQFLKKYE